MSVVIIPDAEIILYQGMEKKTELFQGEISQEYLFFFFLGRVLSWNPLL